MARQPPDHPSDPQGPCTVAGLGVLIEKTFQPGREKLESQGIHVYAQASIKAFENGKVVF